ncbi:MAG: hypothetical protein K0S08_1371 [Gammaproteobacteria bacterium]|jgi:ABC-type uncharacterized transport system auxiliary subunit|nr:hypothetical protein [Gammaproteobacteria bacterium]
MFKLHTLFNGKFRLSLQGLALVAAISSLTACVNLGPAPKEHIESYVLTVPDAAMPAQKLPMRQITVQVGLGQAVVGYRSEGMAYQDKANQVNYFAYHRWLSPPVTMITTEIAKALNQTGAYQAVVAAPLYAGNVTYQIGVQLLALKQDFSDNNTHSQERLSLQVVVVRVSDNKTMAAKTFETNEEAAPTPEGGVVAANQALARLIPSIMQFVLKEAS